jgi:deoxycytidylate deaminase
MSLARPEAETELFIGLVGAVGTDLRTVVVELKNAFRALDYEVIEIRMSHLLREIPFLKKGLTGEGKWPEHTRIKKHMDAGDALRRRVKDGGALAAVAMNYIRAIRGPKPDVLRRRLFIFNSLKHHGEVALLRSTYGGRFLLLSAYEQVSVRQGTLAKLILKSYSKNPRGAGPSTEKEAENLALALMGRDEQDPADEYGQSVRKTFPAADVFVRMGRSLGEDIRRFVHLLFGAPDVTPSKIELAMMTARAAALRSADLSRQVGSVIIEPNDGSIIATGCNEVPKPGGGAYWEGDHPDRRDFCIGGDPSALMKREIQKEMLARLQHGKWLKAETTAPENLLQRAEAEGLLEDARVSSLLEFGRIVHAEMASLLDAARRGVAVQGATIVCTTFPCHMCARHIIAAGIGKVVYIEPYPKSMAHDLYPGAIRGDDWAVDPLAVIFEPFVGVSPNWFTSLFTMPARKDKYGYAIRWEPNATSRPKIRLERSAYLDIETAICNELAVSLQGKPHRR